MDLLFIEVLKPYASQIEKIAIGFTEYTKSNPVVGGMIGVWLLTCITYVFKQIPSKFYNFLQRQFTVTVTVHNRDETFYHLLKWYDKKGFGKKARTLRVNNGRWGNDKMILSAGFGYHYFWWGFRVFKLVRSEEKASIGNDVKELISISTYGRSQAPIRALLDDIVPDHEQSETRIYLWGSDGWLFQRSQPGRSLESVVLPQKQKDLVLRHLSRFKADKEWYLDNGIPYRTGICTSGPPGTGKTSFARALCTHLNKDLYRLSLNFVSDRGLEKALNSVGGNAIVLIEDIDSFAVTKSRRLDRRKIVNPNDAPKGPPVVDKAFKEQDSNPSTDEIEARNSFLTLSGVLNAIDGVAASDGRILLVTTNAPEKLDPALLREGRIDIVTELGYLCDETFRDMLGRFYPEFKVPENVVWRDKIAPAKLQGLVITNRNDPAKVLAAVSALTPVSLNGNKTLP